MATTTVTVSTAAIDALTPGQLRKLDAAVRAIDALEPTDTAIARAVKGAMSVRSMGYSGRGTAAILAARSGGCNSVATVARLLQAADAITGDDVPDMGDSGVAITAVLYRIACKGKKEDVRRAGQMIRKASTGDDAHTVVKGVLAAILADRKRAALTPANRGPANAGGKGKGRGADDAAADAAADAPATGKGKGKGKTETLAPTGVAAASIRVLLTNLADRLSKKAATLTSDDVDVFESIAARVAELVDADKVVTIKG